MKRLAHMFICRPGITLDIEDKVKPSVNVKQFSYSSSCTIGAIEMA